MTHMKDISEATRLVGLGELVIAYRDLEDKICTLMGRLCASECGRCAKVCCRSDFCQESLVSPWLRLVRRTFTVGRPVYRRDAGWLTREGCQLTAGRPPVCYEFLCETLLNRYKPTKRRAAIMELAFLISRLGNRILGHRHLVTLTRNQIQAQLNYGKLNRRLSDAARAYEGIVRQLASPASQIEASFSAHQTKPCETVSPMCSPKAPGTFSCLVVEA